MIKPTVGRIVWYFNDVEPGPLAAIVCHVHDDRKVNLTVFNKWGQPYPGGEVPLVQDNDERPSSGAWCEWMPYQKGQAAKAEAAEKIAEGYSANMQR